MIRRPNWAEDWLPAKSPPPEFAGVIPEAIFHLFMAEEALDTYLSERRYREAVECFRAVEVWRMVTGLW